MTIKKNHFLLGCGIALIAILAFIVWVWPIIRGIWPVVGLIVESTPQTRSEWHIERLAVDIPGVRDLVRDTQGNIWASQTSEGIVSRFDPVDGTTEIMARGLQRPHGLAFYPDDPSLLYIAEEERIVIFDTNIRQIQTVIASLPKGGRHFTRSLAFGPDSRLFVSIGSTCDVCIEENPEHGSIISMKADGSDRRFVARGLRNAVFITFGPDGRLWATEMGRDFLGDDLPPEEINIIDTDGPVQNYGWPICYGNRVHDSQFDRSVYIRDPCTDSIPPVITIPAHSAPLGLAFHDGELIVALHGSWNRSVPVGYKVIQLDPARPFDAPIDLATGFLVDYSTIGRPVDVLPMPDGSILVSDDKGGSIWRLSPVQ